MTKTFIIKIILLPIILVGLHYILNYDRIQIDGFRAEICCLIFGEDTRYTDKLSHRNFRKLKVGMTEKQVLDLLGKPLTRFCWMVEDKCSLKDFFAGRFVGLKYADSPNSENYHVRIVHLDKGIVVRVLGELWYD